jgi:hypothetical protein
MKRIGHFQIVKSDEWFEIGDSIQLLNVYQRTSKLFTEIIIPKLDLISNDAEMELIWLNDKDSATTEFQRLLNLSVLLTKRDAENRNKIITDLKEYAKANRLSIDYHLKQLDING